MPYSILFQTYVDDGNNQGFSFPADTSVLESDVKCCYGGVAYSFSSGQLNIWQPASTSGYIVYIDNKWGDSKNLHESTKGILKATVVKASDSC